MSSVLQLCFDRISSRQQDLYATPKDFEELFLKEMTNLCRLSICLAGDAQRAETCLKLAMEDCLRTDSVAKHRVHMWARRMLIRHAIRLVLGVENEILCEAALDFPLQASEFRANALRNAIRNLPDLDRLALVICAIERYSILDCALLLRKAPQDVYQAVVRATHQIASQCEKEGPGGKCKSARRRTVRLPR